jgi:hypothetical protein
MFGIPLPWLIIGLSVALFGSYRGGYHYGWSDRDAEMQIEIAKKNDEARSLEQAMTSKLIDKEKELRKAKDEISKKQSTMRQLASTGELRLPSSCVQASTNSTPASGDRNTDASELERQTINALIDIVSEGDKAIVQLNACIAAYDEVREKVNGQR